MICSWRWFIHPATAISTNRNGSRTLGISLAYIVMLKTRGDEPARIHRSSFRTIRVCLRRRDEKGLLLKDKFWRITTKSRGQEAAGCYGGCSHFVNSHLSSS